MRRNLLEMPWAPINPDLEAYTGRLRLAKTTGQLARQLLDQWHEGAFTEDSGRVISATPVLLSPIPSTIPISEVLSTPWGIFAVKRRMGPSWHGAVDLDPSGTRNEGLKLAKVGHPTNVLHLTKRELGKNRTPGITPSGLVVTGHLQQLGPDGSSNCIAPAADPDLRRIKGPRIVIVAGTLRQVLRQLPEQGVPGLSGLEEWQAALKSLHEQALASRQQP